MADAPLMPKATAVWLVENTSLTFEQIAQFCRLHELEVKGIADGDVAQGIRGMDPVASGQLTRDEIEKAQADSSYRLRISGPKVKIPVVKTKKGPKYTPLSRRQDRPSAIAWLIRNHPELRDSEIVKLVGTTKPTIQAIRDRTHWNSANIQPQDPVALGLCSQIELDMVVRKAGRRAEKEQGLPERAGTLLPTSETVQPEPASLVAAEQPMPAPAEVEEVSAENVFGAPQPAPEPVADEQEDIDADSVFAKLATLKLESEADANSAEDTGSDKPADDAGADADVGAEAGADKPADETQSGT